MTSVAVLGGGIGGLSAAHELAERGFSVTVYEKNDRFGGKARSLPGPLITDDSHLPAEHGFRFFPGFYRHVTDTMSRIPYGGQSVEDNLVETTEFLQATADRQWTMPTASPRTLGGIRNQVWALFGGDDVPAAEKGYFLTRIFQLLTSCDRRWREQYDEVSWWEFIDADRMSPGYQKILGRGITQLFVAVHPEVASTRTVGRIYLQMLQGHFDESMEVDYVLDGPTNDVWIDPWVTYLEDLGVDLRLGATVEAIESDGDRVTGVRIEEGTEEYVVDADHYVSALPIEGMRDLLHPELERAAPSLRGIPKLQTAFMNGVQFYLTRDVPMIEGHGIYYDSPWALTTVSQRQFWTDYDDTYFDEGEVEGILSVVISDWHEPGVLYGKPVHACSPEQIKDEVLAQLEQHVSIADETRLTDDVIFDWFLDPAIEYGEEGEARSSEPLLINTVGSFEHRPEAVTDAENLVLAADYVRTYTDLATMEAANEAARRAVNAVLERSGTTAPPCAVSDLSFPPLFDELRKIDARLYRRGLSHPGTAISRLDRAYDGIKRSG
jgi:uncharacterized protein with NAD-binding domain and iron-sulfur cluster